MHRNLSLLVLGLILCSASAWGQSPAGEEPAAKGQANPKAKAKAAKDKPQVAITPQREAAVITFVKEHHPELADLVEQLKSSRPKEYEKAIRDLFRASERLAQIKERDSAQYELEVKLWQSQSRVQLLAARVKMSDSQDLRDELRAALNEQLDCRLALLRREQERLTSRASDLDQQMKKLSANRQDMVDRQVQTLAGSKTVPVKKPRPKANADK